MVELCIVWPLCVIIGDTVETKVNLTASLVLTLSNLKLIS